jgi:Na+/phosphate symporter
LGVNEPVDTNEVGPGNINAGRLWVGGFATAIVAALIVIVGVYIARGILNIPVLAPKAASNFGNSTTAVYAALAAVTTLVATGLLHVLLLGAPRPLVFFTWITGLAVLAVAAAPFTQPASTSSKVFTCVLNVVAGRVVISLLTAVAHTAIKPHTGPPPPDPGRRYPPDTERRYPPDATRPYPQDPERRYP